MRLAASIDVAHAALPDHVHDNIESIAKIREEAENAVTSGQRAIEATTRVLVRPWMVFAMVIGVAAWIIANVVEIETGHEPIDRPPFFWLQGAIGLYIAFVSTLVLVTQRRQSAEAERRSHLEFHLNLLGEQKATKIIALLEELRRDLPNVKNRRDSVAEALQEEVDPNVVHSALKK